MRKQSFRPGAIDPIRHNRAIRLRNELRRARVHFKDLGRSFRKLGRAAEQAGETMRGFSIQYAWVDEVQDFTPTREEP